MLKFHFLFSWTFFEISCESKKTIWGFLTKFSVEQRMLFHWIFALKRKFSKTLWWKASVYCLLLEILHWIDSIVCHAIYAIYPSYNVHEIHDRSSAGVKSQIQMIRNIRFTYQNKDFNFGFIPEKTKHRPVLINVIRCCWNSKFFAFAIFAPWTNQQEFHVSQASFKSSRLLSCHSYASVGLWKLLLPWVCNSLASTVKYHS